MLKDLLSEHEADLLRQERAALAEVRDLLVRIDASAEDRAHLRRSIEQLDELFLLVVVGEFNAGKSTLINALLGRAQLKVGVTPTTSEVHAVYLSEGADAVPLRIVDTPGTNSLDQRHQAITEEFIPRADLVLFVTSADRPLSDSERRFLESIRDWGKKILFVVNKVDILADDGARDEVLTYVRDKSRQVLSLDAEVLPVTAHRALRAKEDDDGAAFVASGFAAFEDHLRTTLDAAERLKLKLGNPLGVAESLVRRYAETTRERLDLLGADFEALEQVERQLDLYQEDLGREFRFRLRDVEAELLQLEKAGHEFFEETVRVGRVFDLMNKSKIRSDFERDVIGDVPQRIEKRVADVIDWLVDSELRQWQTIYNYISQRRAAHAKRMVGELTRFDLDRRRLLDTVGRASSETLDGFDRKAESARLAESAQTAVAQAALLEVGAVGLGTVLTLLATTQLVDVTGMVVAGGMAIFGFFVLPHRRRRAKKELSERIGTLRGRLVDSLTGSFDREVKRSAQGMRESIGPYSRFVRSEQDTLRETENDLDTSLKTIAELRVRVEAIASPDDVPADAVSADAASAEPGG